MAFSYLTARVNELGQTYKALQGEVGQPQSATSAIDKLCERLANGDNPDDRRAALLGIKGLSRDYRADTGQVVLPTLLAILERDAAEDPEMGKIALETLNVLCESEDAPQNRGGSSRLTKEITPGMRNSDRFLATERPLHALLALLGSPHFYVRYFGLQLLGTLLASRPDPVQKQILTAPDGLRTLVDVLEDKREIIRNEGLLLLISLTSTNADIQKIASFVGAFDKLFKIIDLEGGIASGGIVVQDCLAAIVGLLRFNASNQNYFRETGCIPLLAPLLLFPPLHLLTEPAQPETQHAMSAFAQQYWPDQKITNAELIVGGLIRMLVAGAGEGRSANQKALLASGVTHCLIELALASNAPSTLKATALLALSDIFKDSPPNQDLFTNLMVQPLIPTFPEATSPINQQPPEETIIWQRAQPVSAILALIALGVQGDPGLGPDASSAAGLKTRAAAVGLFEAHVANNPDVQVNIVTEMKPSDQPKQVPDLTPPTAGQILLAGIKAIPSSLTTQIFDSHASFFASLMLAQLLRNTESCKRLARETLMPTSNDEPTSEGDQSIDEERISLVHLVVGNLVLAQREQTNCANNVHANSIMDALAIEWSRVMVGYLVVLSIWCWESPKTVKEFLNESANLQVLIQPISQASGVDSVVQGLCAFLLGILYEYNRDKSAIDRQTMHPILHSRVGPDQFVNKIARLREDNRFKNVGPDILEMSDDNPETQYLHEDGFWFDWPFVEFVRNNYLSVQRAILLDPGSSDFGRNIDAAESAELIANLRMTIANQTKDLDSLQRRCVEIDQERSSERRSFQEELGQLTSQIQQLKDFLASAEETSRARLSESEEQSSTLSSQLVIVRSELDSVKAASAAKDRELEELRQQAPSNGENADPTELQRLRDQISETQSKHADSEKEQEDLLILLEEVTSKRKIDKVKMREAGMEVSDDDDDDDELNEEEAE